MSLGMIINEVLSNSIKHNTQNNNCIIDIEIVQDDKISI